MSGSSAARWRSVSMRVLYGPVSSLCHGMMALADARAGRPRALSVVRDRRPPAFSRAVVSLVRPSSRGVVPGEGGQRQRLQFAQSLRLGPPAAGLRQLLLRFYARALLTADLPAHPPHVAVPPLDVAAVVRAAKEPVVSPQSLRRGVIYLPPSREEYASLAGRRLSNGILVLQVR